MKKLLILFAATLFVSCDQPTAVNDPNARDVTGFGAQEYSTLTIDSCEYLLCHVHIGTVLVHKGSCKFCQQRMKKLFSQGDFNNSK